ncbi:hypothetical protein B0H14DRAFT_2624672 [Mycena olivaceomarginata]|nr:hypothetical protein B0H14DRAFT_2624672 [Mycena olivaceomarginata]
MPVVPLPESADDTLQGLPVTNFQDMSAILSLLAADTVERKLSSEASFDWERMSSVWSVFGLVGALRAHLKIAASIAGSERAGVDLFGAATYTARQTMSSMCYWKVGRTNRPLMWRDSTNQLLSRLDTTGSPGFAQYALHWDILGVLGIQRHADAYGSMFTMAIGILPTLILMPNLRELSTIQKITVAVQVATAGSAGSLTPILLHHLNSVGLPHLTQLSPDRYMFAGLIKQGDHVVTSLPAGTSPTEMAPRSGDYGALRILCSLNAIAILAAYLSNYIVLGAASGVRQYIWLGVEVFILTARYILWSLRPVWFPPPPTVSPLYSLRLRGDPNSAPMHRANFRDSHPLIDPVVLEFAVASTCSKQSNLGFPPYNKVERPILFKLAGVAPADIILAEYTLVGSHYVPAAGALIEVIRLPWSFVEELYLGQGIILGNNPWALGGMYLGAVICDGTFLGLTTLHPFAAHIAQCNLKKCIAEHDQYHQHTVTMDGYLVSHDHYGHVLRPFHRVDDVLLDWHQKFRDNVEKCRRSAKANGPSHIEIRASSFAPVLRLRTNITRTQETMDLAFVKSTVKHAQEKRHSECYPWLSVMGDGGLTYWQRLGNTIAVGTSILIGLYTFCTEPM